MRRLLLAGAILLGVLAACETTGVPVCDANADAIAVATVKNGRFDCTPTEISLPPEKDGWYDGNGTMYIRPDPYAPYVTRIMWHELGHLVLHRLVGDVLIWQIPDDTREWWADGYAWCHKPQPGFSYRQYPTDCSPYNV